MNDNTFSVNLQQKLQPSLSFDSLLSSLKFGPYQLKVYLVMGLLSFVEGANVMVFTLMIPVLANEWGVSEYTNGLQSSLIFVSFMLGCLISGQAADRFGRKKPCLITAFATIILGFLQATSSNIVSLIFFRIFGVLCIGFFAPLGATILAEITPKELRGIFMALIQGTLGLGMVFGIGMGLFFLENLQKGNWRLLIIVSNSPAIIALLLGLFFLEESPRFELLSGNHEKCFKIIEKINRQNGRRAFFELPSQYKQNLINWALQISQNKPASIKSLFQGNGKKITPILWINWFTASFIYYGIVFYLPEQLQKLQNRKTQKGQSDIQLLLLSTLTELLSVFFSALIIEVKNFGRKNSMISFYILTAVSSLMVYFDQSDRFIIWVTVSKLFLAMTFIFCFQYTSESYATKIRTTGIGIASGLGRLGGILMPWIYVALTKINLLTPYLLYVGLAIFSAFASLTLPFDTTGIDLDQDSIVEKDISVDEKETECNDSGQECDSFQNIEMELKQYSVSK